MSASMNLNDHQRSSDVWGLMKEYCDQRIGELQRENEGDRTPEQTAKIRGRIAEVRRFLRAGEPAREVVAGDD